MDNMEVSGHISNIALHVNNCCPACLEAPAGLVLSVKDVKMELVIVVFSRDAVGASARFAL